eukprot:CAMPEP_0197449280 /NCGR_PEP_ID=MMETSP1175-20131217/20790_1 /TAXON_ID=1003142 /ORGANISM="Triceratium dubium, Strain CCMP147" /LENGTH=143 /DNA_ID=CAMNT_0042981355 /DNA_START=66 /DNA_END=497 /DNA_ORIENTATION=+
MARALVAITLLALAATATADVWSNCGRPGDHAKNLQLTLSPDPPVKGKPFTISGSFTLDEQLTNVTATYSAEGILHGSINICEELKSKNAPVQCPLPAGAQSFGPYTFTIPSSIPSGIPIFAQVDITDQNNQEVGCVKIDITF